MKVTLCDRCSRQIDKPLTTVNRFAYFKTSNKPTYIDLCPTCLEEFKLMLGMGTPKPKVTPRKEPENDD